jgi:hypothetical protein
MRAQNFLRGAAVDKPDRYAPGWPGIEARWTSSAKSAVGTSLGSKSSVWFTLSHGIFNEIYFPRIDRARTEDTGLGIHRADLATDSLPEGRCIRFTFYWPDAGHWEGVDFAVEVAAA